MTTFITPENNVFFTVTGYFLNECQIINMREKAVRVKVTTFLAYPGVADLCGTEIGFAWIPKKALTPHKELKDTYYLAPWMKMLFTKK